MLCCTNFIKTKKLNDLQAILGAEFLFNENRTVMLQKNEITILYNNEHFRLKMNKISEKGKLCAEPFVHSKLDMTCGNCITNPMIVPNNMIYLANIYINDLENKFSVINAPTQEKLTRNPDEIEDSNICGISDVLVLCDISLNTSNFEYENETLPDSDEFFNKNQEIKFDSLEKKYSIEDGDFEFCPPTWIKKS